MGRRVTHCLAVMVLSAGSAAAAAEGQMTWAVHFTIAPGWFDPGEHTQGITPLLRTTRSIAWAVWDTDDEQAGKELTHWIPSARPRASPTSSVAA